MPRVKPEPEDAKRRTSISLPAKIVAVANTYRMMHPEENLADFSALVGRALLDYAAKKHPDLLHECIRSIRGNHERDLAEKQERRAAKKKKLGRVSFPSADAPPLPTVSRQSRSA